VIFRMFIPLGLLLSGSPSVAKTLRSKEPTAEAIKVRYEKYWLPHISYYNEHGFYEQSIAIDSEIISITAVKCKKTRDEKNEDGNVNFHSCKFQLNYGKEGKVAGTINMDEVFAYDATNKFWHVMGRRAA
jgi:hypothetical protein